ncbi:hypothetical protein HPB48_006349 [Haemaphysalis longicornis]|uniref:Secreted protein n=1 Tax=Haemaphysalis longicornis TaxID=44386 RepID=A0A9J6GXC0_HAELO|nr:hypothetical protein HPB48_006349 [Haemaphysalis longicornis]
MLVASFAAALIVLKSYTTTADSKLAIVLTSALTNTAVRPVVRYCAKIQATPAQQIQSASTAVVFIALTTAHGLTGKPRMQPFARQHTTNVSPRLHAAVTADAAGTTSTVPGKSRMPQSYPVRHALSPLH